jgi:hypothetical protein
MVRYSKTPVNPSKGERPFSMRSPKQRHCCPFVLIVTFLCVASKARGSDLRVHFKNTFEVAAAIRGMQIDAAERFPSLS